MTTKSLHVLMIYLVVFIAGAALMSTEIVAARLLAPYFGLSIPVWSGLIAVVMAALSFGYCWGGSLADRVRVERICICVSRLILAASASFLIIASFQSGISGFFSGRFEGPYSGAIISSLFLFAPPSFMLAGILPLSVKFLLKSSESAGRTYGWLSACSTLGSIAGTLFTGLWLISNAGSEAIIYGLGLIFLIIHWAICAIEHKALHFSEILISAAVAIAYIFFPAGKNEAGAEWIVDTAYSRAVIKDQQDGHSGTTLRSLRTDPFVIQAKIRLYVEQAEEADPFNSLYRRFSASEDRLALAYTRYFRLVDYFMPEVKSALMIGGAAYSVPVDFLERHPAAKITVVEIDPGMTKIARHFFNLQTDSRMTIEHTDGRFYLNQPGRSFDAIFLDAFGSGINIPFQLVTRECVEKFFSALNADGVMIVNFFSSIEGENSEFLRSLAATFNAKFSSMRFFSVEDKASPSETRNMILVAIKGRPAPARTAADELKVYLSTEFRHQSRPEDYVYSDNFAPTEKIAYGLIREFKARP